MEIKINCSHSEVVPIHKIQPNPKNPNKHPEKQIELLAKLIDYQGWRHPIIISNRSGFICAGHGRLEAAKKLGLEKCPVDYQDFDSEAQEYAFMISDNKIPELSEHDDSMMISEIAELGIIDTEILGVEHINFDFGDLEDQDDMPAVEDVNKKHTFIAEFPNDIEMRECADYLSQRGYIVRIK